MELLEKLRKLFSVKNLVEHGTKGKLLLSSVPYGHHYGLDQSHASLRDFIESPSKRSMRGYSDALWKALGPGDECPTTLVANTTNLENLSIPLYAFGGQDLVDSGTIFNSVHEAVLFRTLFESLGVRGTKADVKNSTVWQQYLGPPLSAAPFHSHGISAHH